MAWLDEQRRLRGWVRKLDLAAAIQVTQETISDLYRRRATSAATFAKIRAALKATPVDGMTVRLMGESVDAEA